jgi:short subunit dehydrogenase-like uncharacterized protein
MIENISRGGAVRRDGRITPVPAAWKTIRVDLGKGPVEVTTIPWGDVATAWYSTGIPDIEVYTRTNARMRAGLKASRYLGRVLASGPVQRLLKRRIQRAAPGPGEAARIRGVSRVAGEVSNPAGTRARARLTGPEGYTMTCAHRRRRPQAHARRRRDAGVQDPIPGVRRGLYSVDRRGGARRSGMTQRRGSRGGRFPRRVAPDTAV